MAVLFIAVEAYNNNNNNNNNNNKSNDNNNEDFIYRGQNVIVISNPPIDAFINLLKKSLKTSLGK